MRRARGRARSLGAGERAEGRWEGEIRKGEREPEGPAPGGGEAAGGRRGAGGAAREGARSRAEAKCIVSGGGA